MKDPGYFDDKKREYVIQEMHPPRRWLNYLWNERLIASIDQFGMGSSWHYEKGNRTNLCRGDDNRILFIRDENTGKFWAANRNYFNEKFDEFYTVVGQGYSRIVSRYHGIKSSFLLFIPEEGNFECWETTVENTGNKAVKLGLFAYADIYINSSGHAAYNHGCFDRNLNGVFLSHHGFDLTTEYTNIFFSCDGKVSGYDTTNLFFKGIYGDIREPEAVKAGRSSSKDASFDDAMISALHFQIQLKPGEKRRLRMVLGLSRNIGEAVRIARGVFSGKTSSSFEAIQKRIARRSEEFMRKVMVSTPDKDINSIANIWIKRQISLGKTWGRCYSKGFRDLMQDITGFVTFDSKEARAKIKYCLQYQYADGNTLRSWEPILDHPYVDGASWIVPAVAVYIKETGDIDFLREEVPYYGGKIKGSVLDHCRRGMNYLLSRTGKHGMALWGGGDWNDSLNNAGIKGIGESVWLSEATVKSAGEFAELLEVIGRKSEAKNIRLRAEKMRKSIMKHAWESGHFICGYNDWGEKVGSSTNREGKIFLNMQTWGVLSGVLDRTAAVNLMDRVEKELSCDFGYVLSKPSYTKSDEHIGRVSYFEKGSYENGSVYNHGVAFKIAADCMLGRGERAYESVKKMLATNPRNPAIKSGTEPYAMTNMYIGPENSLRKGESLYGWITGTAGWLYRCMVEFMIGVRADYKGLKISPCLNSNWKEIKVNREYRNASYEILIKNPHGLQTGTLEIRVDGKKILTDILPDYQDGRKHIVVVDVCK